MSAAAIAAAADVLEFVNGWAEGAYTVFYEARASGDCRSNLLKCTVDVVDCAR